AVGRLLAWAQPFVDGSVARALNPYVPYSGFADSTGLGSIEELALSPRVVMRVWTGQPQKLRARAYTRFDGSVWHAPPAEAGLPLRPATTAPAPDLSRWLAAVPG